MGLDPVEAGRTLVVVWQVESDDASPVEVSLTGTVARTGLPPTGALSVPTTDATNLVTVTLLARNGCGTQTRRVQVRTFRRLYLEPDPVSVRTDSAAALTVRSSCPVDSDLLVTLTAGSTGPKPKVDVPASLTIASGTDRTTVQVRPPATAGTTAYLSSLEPARPAAVVTATATGHETGRADIWVEPPDGQPRVLTTEPGMVAVHVALLPSGEVLMFAADHSRFNDIDALDARVWNPITGTLRTPTFPYPTHKNLFCSGHCQLPDGRVLIVGGHAIFGGGSAAKKVHTFDPTTSSFVRHAAMQKDRWYPTCLTLPDGRALISSGSEGGGPPVFKGVVRDVEVFDPSNGSLAVTLGVHGDICMYPQMFVLPGGLVFFHSRNVSWLYAAGPGQWTPTNGTWSAGIPMNSSVTRSYPGMAACALLPLLPEDGYRTRVLMAGGGGAKECDLGADTAATRSAEILDVDPAATTGSWRNTDATGNPLQTTAPRFLTDAVLLPDATVLLVNGANTGKADHSHGPVRLTELFDPRTETFRPAATVTIARQYHGSALLLPDGRVALGGHTKEFNHPPAEMDRFEIEAVSPGYLFRGPRPRVLDVSLGGAVLPYGGTLRVTCDRAGDIRRVALLRPGSATHQLNTDQRYVGLSFAVVGEGTLSAVAPPDAWVAPPGYYLLFVVDHRGVPSVGRAVRVG